MKIRIETIPTEGTLINGELSLESLNSRLSNDKRNLTKITSTPKASVKLTPNLQGAIVEGVVKYSTTSICSKCGEDITSNCELPCSAIFQETTKINPDPEIGIVYFTKGEDGDIGLWLEEEILANIELFPSCNANCQSQAIQTPTGKNLGELLLSALKKTG